MVSEMIDGSDGQVFLSSDVSLDFSVRITALCGQLPHSRITSVENEIFVSARLAAKDEALTNEVCTTVIVHADGVAEWKENLKFPIKIRDLSLIHI